MRILVCCIILAGCAGLEMPRTYYHWMKAGGNAAGLDSDWRECVGVNSSSSRIIEGGVVRAEAVDPGKVVECMKGRGYSLDGTRRADDR
jgi:hypothetical protein